MQKSNTCQGKSTAALPHFHTLGTENPLFREIWEHDCLKSSYTKYLAKNRTFEKRNLVSKRTRNCRKFHIG